MRKINQTEEIIQKVFPALELSTLQLANLEAYLSLLEQWNQVFNLTAVKGRTESIYKHILDALVPLALQDQLPCPLKGSGLDLGSGAGVPGLVLSICDPHLDFLSVDGVQKKIAFQKIVAAKTKTTNFAAVHTRFEQLTAAPQYKGRYDFVCARALATLDLLASWSRDFLKPNGLLWAWKGQEWPGEWEALQASGDFQQLAALNYDLGEGYGGVLLVLRYTP